MTEIPCVRVLEGAVPFKDGNVNDTFRGMVLLEGGERRHGVIKDLSLCQLTNELLAAVLGKELGLPVPDAYLGVVPLGALQVSKLKLSDGSGHVVFVSADTGTPNFAQKITNDHFMAGKILEQLKEWVGLGGLYAFDSWIANTDRHMGNLLIDGPDMFWLIDHGHAFTGPAWAPQDLDPTVAYRHKLSEWLTGALSASQKSKKARESDGFCGKIECVDVPAALSQGRTDKLLSEEYADALRAFLISRVQHVSRCSKEALGVPILTE